MQTDRKHQETAATQVSEQVVGARAANAPVRTRGLQLASVSNPGPASGEKDEGTSGLRADQPAARAAPTTDAPAPTGDAAAAPGPAPSWRKRILLGALALLLLAAAGWYGQYYLTVGRYLVSTDDAYVHAYSTTLAAKISGYVASIDVAENSFVRAGDVIAHIDDGDYRLAVDAARDKVETQRATVARIHQQIPAAQAQVEQVRAQLVSAQAVLTRAESEYQRQLTLTQHGYASKQAFEQATANRDQASASLQSAQAAIDAAVANVNVVAAQEQEAARTLKELQTAHAKAERDLSFTLVRAPVDGVIGNRAANVGDFVQTGTRLASIVPLDDVYIDANFKETQLSRLRVGQEVRVSVDALPQHDITATVASVSPASGSVFTLLPPDNATGNFTKIVQRLPVRISLPADVKTKRLLRPGMSVVVSVDTKSEQVAAHSEAAIAAAPSGNNSTR